MNTVDRLVLVDRLAVMPGRLAIVAARAAAVEAAPGGPAAGEWSVAQVVGHLLGVEEEVWLPRLERVATESNPRWTWAEPGSERASGRTLDDLLNSFADVRQRVVAILEGFDDAGWARVGTHATYGVLDVAGLMTKAADHDDQHRATIAGLAVGPTRAARLARFRTGSEDVEQALAGVPAAALDHVPADGSWTARQVVHHLADSETTASIRLRRLIAEDEPAIIGYDEPEYARRLHYERPIASSLAVLVAVRQASLELLESLEPADWERAGMHSESGTYSVERWLAIYAEHAHDHANQIREAIGGS